MNTEEPDRVAGGEKVSDIVEIKKDPAKTQRRTSPYSVMFTGHIPPTK